MNDTIGIRIQRVGNNNDLPLPEYKSPHAAGMDIYAAVEGPVTINPGEISLIPTGLAISLPIGYEAQVKIGRAHV